jgi:hypothetical protein
MDSSKWDIATARRMIGAGLLGRRIGILVRLAETVAAEQEDFGVLHQAIVCSLIRRGPTSLI